MTIFYLETMIGNGEVAGVFAEHDRLTDRVERLALKTMMGHAGFLPGFLFAFASRSGVAEHAKRNRPETGRLLIWE